MDHLRVDVWTYVQKIRQKILLKRKLHFNMHTAVSVTVYLELYQTSMMEVFSEST